MFAGCESLSYFETTNLNKLTQAAHMFRGTKIPSFNINLPSLSKGDEMFFNSSIEVFQASMQNITTAITMFYGAWQLTRFISNTPLLTNGDRMFSYAPKLIEVSSNFSSLIIGIDMFRGCSSLASFMCKLKADDAEYSPLTNGTNMFRDCKLDTLSVENILTSLQPFTDGSEHIMTMRIQSAAVEKFNEITGNTLTLNSTYQNVPFRGWTVQVAII